MWKFTTYDRRTPSDCKSSHGLWPGELKMDNPEKLATYGTQDEDKNNTIRVGHHYTQANTNNVNKSWSLLQTTGGKISIIEIEKFICTQQFLLSHTKKYLLYNIT